MRISQSVFDQNDCICHRIKYKKNEMDEFKKVDLKPRPRPFAFRRAHRVSVPFVEFDEVVNGFGETRSAYQL